MKFSNRRDIEGSIKDVFAVLTDFATHEHLARDHGAEVERFGSISKPESGLRWKARFFSRGRRREAEIKLDEMHAPKSLRLTTKIGGLSGQSDFELIALSKTRTRMIVGIDLRPESIGARLLIQSLKLAKKRLDKRFERRLAQLARRIEDRIQGLI